MIDSLDWLTIGRVLWPRTDFFESPSLHAWPSNELYSHTLEKVNTAENEMSF